MDNGAMLILEAKDMAADKMSSGMDKKKKEETESIEGELLDELKKLLDGWDDMDHDYYKELKEALKTLKLKLH